MDNLFNLFKLCRAAYKESALVHGVAQTNGRGLPKCVIQAEAKSKRDQDKVRGTVKVAVLKENEMAPIIACSVYDAKPVHLLSTVSKDVKWIIKERKVWDSSAKKKVDITFLHLNMIDEYNFGMGGVDIFDQLRLQFCLERFI